MHDGGIGHCWMAMVQVVSEQKTNQKRLERDGRRPHDPSYWCCCALTLLAGAKKNIAIVVFFWSRCTRPPKELCRCSCAYPLPYATVGLFRARNTWN